MNHKFLSTGVVIVALASGLRTEAGTVSFEFGGAGAAALAH